MPFPKPYDLSKRCTTEFSTQELRDFYLEEVWRDEGHHPPATLICHYLIEQCVKYQWTHITLLGSVGYRLTYIPLM